MHIDKLLQPADALHIYALKTAPAFEAAIYAGVRLAGPAEAYSEAIGQFARHLGVAFQVLNDLDDWQGDSHNKLLAGGDVLGGRPTVLWALALEALEPADCERLHTLVGQVERRRFGDRRSAATIRSRRRFRKSGTSGRPVRTAGGPSRRSPGACGTRSLVLLPDQHGARPWRGPLSGSTRRGRMLNRLSTSPAHTSI